MLPVELNCLKLIYQLLKIPSSFQFKGIVILSFHIIVRKTPYKLFNDKYILHEFIPFDMSNKLSTYNFFFQKR